MKLVGRKPLLTPAQLQAVRESEERRRNIPTVREWAESLGVSAGTLRRALRYDYKNHRVNA